MTGSIAGLMPGTYQAVYNGTKAFVDSFCFALRHELKDSGVTVTCLMPGATETEFFDRADMLDTKVGASKKQDPAEVAKTGYHAMLKGEGDVVAGWQNKLQAAIAAVTPEGRAGQHARRHGEAGQRQGRLASHSDRSRQARRSGGVASATSAAMASSTLATGLPVRTRAGGGPPCPPLPRGGRQQR